MNSVSSHDSHVLSANQNGTLSRQPLYNGHLYNAHLYAKAISVQRPPLYNGHLHTMAVSVQRQPF